MVIKNILREELDNSLRMKEKYEEELSKLPSGSLQKKKIKGKDYYYKVYRDENSKVNLDYLGKGEDLPEEEIERWQQIKERRASIRSSVSQIKKQIKFLRKVLNGKEQV